MTDFDQILADLGGEPGQRLAADATAALLNIADEVGETDPQPGSVATMGLSMRANAVIYSLPLALFPAVAMNLAQMTSMRQHAILFVNRRLAEISAQMRQVIAESSMSTEAITEMMKLLDVIKELEELIVEEGQS